MKKASREKEGWGEAERGEPGGQRGGGRKRGRGRGRRAGKAESGGGACAPPRALSPASAPRPRAPQHPRAGAAHRPSAPASAAAAGAAAAAAAAIPAPALAGQAPPGRAVPGKGGRAEGVRGAGRCAGRRDPPRTPRSLLSPAFPRAGGSARRGGARRAVDPGRERGDALCRVPQRSCPPGPAGPPPVWPRSGHLGLAGPGGFYFCRGGRCPRALDPERRTQTGGAGRPWL